MELGIRNPKSQINYQKSTIRNSTPFFGAIFDWDGVIIDSAKLHEQSWHRLATELGKPIAPGSFLRGFGMKSAWIIEKIHRWATEPAEVARLTERKETLYREIVAQSDIAPLPGAAAWLERLREAGVLCAVASSTHRQNIEAVLDRIGLEHAFREIVSAEDVEHGKPNPEVFAKASERLEDQPEPLRRFRGRARWDRSGARGRHEGGGRHDHESPRRTEGSGPCR